MNKRMWLSVPIIIVMLPMLWRSAAFASDGGICPAGYTSIFNTNQVGCTFCAAPGCDFTLNLYSTCGCSPGDVECCDAHQQCCTNCSEAGSLECTLNYASCKTDCCFTACPLALGDPCTSGAQCASTFCASGVCCNVACTEPNQSCKLPGSVGLCRVLSPAPALSLTVFVVLALLLTGAGVLALARRHIRSSGESR